MVLWWWKAHPGLGLGLLGHSRKVADKKRWEYQMAEPHKRLRLRLRKGGGN